MPSHKFSSLPTVAHSRVCDWAIMGEFITGRGNGQFYLEITSKILNIFSVINIDQIKIVSRVDLTQI